MFCHKGTKSLSSLLLAISQILTSTFVNAINLKKTCH
jgi:hypothetical protein